LIEDFVIENFTANLTLSNSEAKFQTRQNPDEILELEEKLTQKESSSSESKGLLTRIFNTKIKANCIK